MIKIILIALALTISSNSFAFKTVLHDSASSVGCEYKGLTFEDGDLRIFKDKLQKCKVTLLSTNYESATFKVNWVAVKK